MMKCPSDSTSLSTSHSPSLSCKRSRRLPSSTFASPPTPSRSSRPSFPSLPAEVQSHILSYLPLPSLLNVALCSKYLESLIYNSTIIFPSYLKLRKSNPKKSHQARLSCPLRFYPAFLSRLRITVRAAVKTVDWVIDDERSAQVIILLLDTFPNLLELKIRIQLPKMETLVNFLDYFKSRWKLENRTVNRYPRLRKMVFPEFYYYRTSSTPYILSKIEEIAYEITGKKNVVFPRLCQICKSHVVDNNECSNCQELPTLCRYCGKREQCGSCEEFFCSKCGPNCLSAMPSAAISASTHKKDLERQRQTQLQLRQYEQQKFIRSYDYHSYPPSLSLQSERQSSLSAYSSNCSLNEASSYAYPHYSVGVSPASPFNPDVLSHPLPYPHAPYESCHQHISSYSRHDSGLAPPPQPPQPVKCQLNSHTPWYICQSCTTQPTHYLRSCDDCHRSGCYRCWADTLGISWKDVPSLCSASSSAPPATTVSSNEAPTLTSNTSPSLSTSLTTTTATSQTLSKAPVEYLFTCDICCHHYCSTCRIIDCCVQCNTAFCVQKCQKLLACLNCKQRRVCLDCVNEAVSSSISSSLSDNHLCDDDHDCEGGAKTVKGNIIVTSEGDSFCSQCNMFFCGECVDFHQCIKGLWFMGLEDLKT
ncbi:hypothetical protein BKA69DRAFT_606230 [Paraphysoderma sedebokerense]|nr:hypothetical protein BKA69DRAFT_606230 [Paraphysoderma sedebokerense]